MKRKTTNGSRVVLVNEPDALRVYEIYSGTRPEEGETLGRIFLNFYRESYPNHPFIYTSVSTSQFRENRRLKKILKEKIVLAP